MRIAGDQALGDVEHLHLAQRLADFLPGCFQKRVGNAAAHHQLIDLTDQRFQQIQFGRDLGAADDRDQRSRWRFQRLLQRFDFGHKQGPAAGDGRKLGDRVGRGLRAMRSSEGVVDEDVAERRHALRKRLVIGVLAGQKARVLTERNRAGFKCDAVDPMRRETDRHPQQLGQRSDHRLQRRLGLDLALLGPAQMRYHQYRRAGVECQAQRRQRGAQARVVGDFAVLQGHVEILADQNALALEIEGAHFEHVVSLAP